MIYKRQWFEIRRNLNSRIFKARDLVTFTLLEVIEVFFSFLDDILGRKLDYTLHG